MLDILLLVFSSQLLPSLHLGIDPVVQVALDRLGQGPVLLVSVLRLLECGMWVFGIDIVQIVEAGIGSGSLGSRDNIGGRLDRACPIATEADQGGNLSVTGANLDPPFQYGIVWGPLLEAMLLVPIPGAEQAWAKLRCIS